MSTTAFAVLFGSALEWAVGRAADTSIKRLRERLRRKDARAELAVIGERCVEAAVAIAPELREELRSGTFANNVFAPALLAALADPTRGLAAADFAEAYLATFVAPAGSGREPVDVLARVYRMSPEAFDAAFDAFLAKLRTELYSSDHWKEPVRDAALEEVRENVAILMQRVIAPDERPMRDAAAARADAKEASEALRLWPRTIGGHTIDRPELEQLVGRIQSSPAAATLVVGEAGSGKSSLFAALIDRLGADGVVVFAIKADLLPPDVATLDDVSRALGMKGLIVAEIETLARAVPVVLLIDQLDAVSDVMDRQSQRMRLLLQLALRFSGRPKDEGPPVHVLISSRPFEAEHDARFQSLHAETVKLALPPYKAAADLLAGLDVDPDRVPDGLRETLRRPFALKLFVDLVRRGADVAALAPGQLLDEWLKTADLGDPGERIDAVRFLKRLAADMTRAEALWRPADVYDAEFTAAVRKCEASGLVVRHDSRLGFSHQSWLDDFQAKAFEDARALAEYAWDRQDGLFARATVLRGLERLRRVDGPVYLQSVDLLLGTPRTRRHFRHLVVDLIASQDLPLPRESAWVQKLVREDTALARRALPRVAGRWGAWRGPMLAVLPTAMTNKGLRFAVRRALAAEIEHDADAAVRLVDLYWSDPESELDALELFWRAGLWRPDVADRLAGIFSRHAVQSFVISDFAGVLFKAGRTSEAVDLVSLYLDRTHFDTDRDLEIHDLHELAEAAPLEFARGVLPWFVKVATAGQRDEHPVRHRFPRSMGLPWNWDEERTDGVYSCLTRALAACAEKHPDGLIELLRPLYALEVEEVQTLVAEALASGMPRLASEALDFLLADDRRLYVGDAHLDDEHNVGHMVEGLTAQMLVEALASHVSTDDAVRLRDAIEASNPYRPEVGDEDGPKLRRHRMAWADEARFALLEKLPEAIVPARRRRRVAEWRATQPRFPDKRRRPRMAGRVGAAMSVEQMQRASDDEILRLLNEIPDGTGSNWTRRPIARSGGADQLAQTFGAFAKAEPERAVALARRRLRPGAHEGAAGAAVRELAGLETVDASAIAGLVRDLSAAGFVSKEWRHDAAWAFSTIADRLKGLGDDDLALIESWIVDDAQVTADRIARRVEFERRNRELNAGRRKEGGAPDPRPVLFVRMGGGHVLPHDNFTILNALAAGLLQRPEPDRNGWLAALERHLGRQEDPAIWSALLMFRSGALFWADRERTWQFFTDLFARFAEAFDQVLVGQALWGYRKMVPEAVRLAMVRRWLCGDGQSGQAAGEYAAAATFVDGDAAFGAIVGEIEKAGASPALTGALFGAGVVWAESDGEPRRLAHDLLMRHASTATRDEAFAISSAVERRRPLEPDNLTLELLGVIARNRALLLASLGHRLVTSLQELLLSPGFDQVVFDVASAAADAMLAGNWARRGSMVDGDLVAIAVALQRTPGSLRARAMDLYERLLDEEVYGAEAAAEAALARR